MKRVLQYAFELSVLFIITLPSFLSILNPWYYSIHDDQQIARLFLLIQGIGQGSIYPRWVDGLGFGFGYPLFNFYPPLVYYIGFIFHTVGFSYIWSAKLMFIAFVIIGAFGMYIFSRLVYSRVVSYLVTILYTYFFYRAVGMYVRGSLAEFAAASVVPFVLWSIVVLYRKNTIYSALIFGFLFAILILTHPLVAFPSIVFIGIFFLFFLFQIKQKIKFLILGIFGTFTGLALSCFFWLPSMVERQYTLVDTILIKELANYKLHFICFSQLWNSPWGFGGSAPGCIDGMTFQLGKVQLLFFFLSLAVGAYLIVRKKITEKIRLQFLCIILFCFSIFMTLPVSDFIWTHISYLWYMQFPWRFLAFAGIFLCFAGGGGIEYFFNNRKLHVITIIGVLFVSIFVIWKYTFYFVPQRYVYALNTERTSYEEIAWRISSTSYEFAPKEVALKKTDLGTTTIAIEKDQIPQQTAEFVQGKGTIQEKENTFSRKTFDVDVTERPFQMQINTYFFPGWKAFVDHQEIKIASDNTYHLIQLSIPEGKHTVELEFADTPVRKIASLISIVMSGICVFILLTKLLYYSKR